MKKLTFSPKEYSHYEKHKDKAKFSSPEEEYAWEQTQYKECSKCGKVLLLTEFPKNTSGSFPFNAQGIRYRRNDCTTCYKDLCKLRNESRKQHKKNYKSVEKNETNTCECCGKTNTKVVYDHDHTTNTFRGWLCDVCNRAIGMLQGKQQTDIEGLVIALNYANKNVNKTFTIINGKIVIE